MNEILPRHQRKLEFHAPGRRPICDEADAVQEAGRNGASNSMEERRGRSIVRAREARLSAVLARGEADGEGGEPMKDSKIEWTHHTFNPWRGCTKVSAGCANCYAESLSKRNPLSLGIWGPNGTRVVASESMWREPLKWNKQAEAALEQWRTDSYGTPFSPPYPKPERPRVFCASLADVFEDWQGKIVDSNSDVMWEKKGAIVRAGQTTANLVHGEKPATLSNVRDRLFRLIDATPNLDWLLLTKRPENIMKMLPVTWYQGELDPVMKIPDNVWLGTSVEDQKTADERIPHLLKVPAKVRFLSMEPLLGPVRLSRYDYDRHQAIRKAMNSPLALNRDQAESVVPECGVSWVIVGGESGPNARPMHPEWALSIRDQCQAAGAPFFFKQWGDWKPIREMPESEWQQLYEPVREGEPSDSVRECKVETVMFTPEPLPKGALHAFREKEKNIRVRSVDWLHGR